jgi:RimJ/RimL family protein N-acetyltransferase
VDRIFLRPLVKDDITDNYISWFNDKTVTQFLEVRGESLTKQTIIDYIENGRKTQLYYMYAICLAENNKHIGNLKIGPIDYKHNISDLITVIGDRKYWGKGLATEAIRQGIKLSFEKYNIRKLCAGIYSENIASIKSYTKAGFLIEAVLKNHFILNGKYQDKVIISYFNPSFPPNNQLRLKHNRIQK